MARNKEISVVLLDIGPKMAPCLPYAARAVSTYCVSKILNKPSHEVALVFYGTTGTDNPLHQEFADGGDDTQYTNITTIKPLAPPTVDYLTHLRGLTAEQGESDCVDALTVAVDALYRVLNQRPEMEAQTVQKRVILVSNFLEPAKEDEGGLFAATLADKLQAKNIQLDVVSIDDPKQDAGNVAAKQANREALDRVLATASHTVKSVREDVELLSAFRAKEYMHTAYYSGPLRIGDLMTINVKVTKKATQERMPGLDRYSDRSKADDASHAVVYDRAYKRGEGEEEDIPPEDLAKAFKYGAQVVPFQAEHQHALKYAPDKDFQVVGVVPQEAVPHAFFMKDTWVVAPEKGNAQSLAAVSALVQAMREQQLAFIARFLPRTNGEIQVSMLSPTPAQEGQAGTFLMNQLPFEADIRMAGFAAFTERNFKLPHKDQTAAMDAAIDSMMLADGEQERMAPESTANPSLHKFLDVMGRLAVDPKAGVPAEDPLVDRLLKPQIDADADFLAQLEGQFPFAAKQEDAKVGAEAGAVEMLIGDDVAAELEERGEGAGDEIGTSAPTDDFDRLLERGRAEAAFSGLPWVILELIDNSMGNRSHGKAIRCVLRLRGAAAKHGRAQQFNKFLDELAAKYEGSEDHGSFWTALMAERVRPISAAECEGGMPEENASQFLRDHMETQKAEPMAAEPAAVVDDTADEFASME